MMENDVAGKGRRILMMILIAANLLILIIAIITILPNLR